MKQPTIYEALKEKLGRDPTHAELMADMKRINESVLVDMAEKGNLPWQKKRRRQH